MADIQATCRNLWHAVLWIAIQDATGITDPRLRAAARDLVKASTPTKLGKDALKRRVDELLEAEPDRVLERAIERLTANELASRDRAKARRWFQSADCRLVCWLADLDPDSVRERMEQRFRDSP